MKVRYIKGFRNYGFLKIRKKLDFSNGMVILEVSGAGVASLAIFKHYTVLNNRLSQVSGYFFIRLTIIAMIAIKAI